MGLVLRIAILTWLAASFALTAGRARVWGDEYALWLAAHRAAPAKPRPLVNLAGAAANRDYDFALARYWYGRALDAARARGGAELEETAFLAELNLILLQARLGDLAGARRDFEAFVAARPFFRSEHEVRSMLWPRER